MRLSRELERDAIEAGYVEPWQHTNARRSAVRKAYSPRPRHGVPPVPGTQTTASVRASLFSDTAPNSDPD